VGAELRDELVGRLKQGIIDYDETAVGAAAREVVLSGVDPADALMNGLAEGIEVVGDLLAAGQYFAPEARMSADALAAGLDELRPSLASDPGSGLLEALEGTARAADLELVAAIAQVSGLRQTAAEGGRG
jgi:methanogenic corrinoid protein MtbC1